MKILSIELVVCTETTGEPGEVPGGDTLRWKLSRSELSLAVQPLAIVGEVESMLADAAGVDPIADDVGDVDAVGQPPIADDVNVDMEAWPPPMSAEPTDDGASEY